MKKNIQGKRELIKVVYPSRPDVKYYRIVPDEKIQAELIKPSIFASGCSKVCTKTVTLISKTSVDAHSGVGHYMVNVDGYRYINAYVISDPLNSSSMRGFELELSFSLYDFVYGVGVEGETSFCFNFDNWYNRTQSDKPLVKLGTSDLTISGGLPWIGGVDLTHIVRVPVMGKYVRASVFNNDSSDRDVRVEAYLTT